MVIIYKVELAIDLDTKYRVYAKLIWQTFFEVFDTINHNVLCLAAPLLRPVEFICHIRIKNSTRNTSPSLYLKH